MPGRRRGKVERRKRSPSGRELGSRPVRASGASSGKRTERARSEPKASVESSSWERIYAVVRRIPPGRVATYGDVAALARMPGRAREVGWALHALDAESDVPWQRVINARGEISARGETAAARVQRALLESEGVVFGLAGRVDLDAHGFWPGPRAAARKARRHPAARRRRA